MPDVLRTLLAPVLYLQGKRLFQTMPRLPEASGARTGTEGDGPLLRLLIVGDSSAAGVGVATQGEAILGQTVQRLADSHRVTYRLVARHGATIPGTLRHLRTLDAAPFDAAVTSLGVNDIMAGRALEPWLNAYQALTTELKERFEVGLIVVSGLPPVGEFPALPQPLRWVMGRTTRRHDDALRTWTAAEPDLAYAGFDRAPGDPLYGRPMAEVMASDGFHPGPLIYDVWAERVVARIRAAQPLAA